MDNILRNVETDEESIVARHRRERKDLQAEIQSLKKSIAKGDKKRRKEILEEIAKLESNLEAQQSKELNDLNDVRSIQKTTDINQMVADESGTGEVQPRKISKAQRRRERKAKEEREKEADILAQSELNQENSTRAVEFHAIKKVLLDRGLGLHAIASDGDCLYNAVLHQLEITRGISFDVSYLRNETANFILSNKSNLIYYMTNPSTGDILSEDEFEKYCENIRCTAAWGGQVEIQALSNVLRAPIEVLQAIGPPTMQGDEFHPPCLTITYHRHMYSLGEHYNSTKPLTSADISEIDEP